MLGEHAPAGLGAVKSARRARHGALSVVRDEHHHPQAGRRCGRRHRKHPCDDQRPEQPDEQRHNQHNSSPIGSLYGNRGLLDSSHAPAATVGESEAAPAPRRGRRGCGRGRRPGRCPDPEPSDAEPGRNREGGAGAARRSHDRAYLQGRPAGDRQHARPLLPRRSRTQIAGRCLGPRRPGAQIRRDARRVAGRQLADPLLPGAGEDLPHLADHRRRSALRRLQPARARPASRPPRGPTCSRERW